MIERIYDPSVVDAVSNHPSVFPFICAGRDKIDSTDQVNDQRNIYLAGEAGIVAFEYIRDGEYEIHVRVLPAGRGKWALGFVYSCLFFIFQSGATKIWTRVPEGNIACRAIVRGLCTEYEFTLPVGWYDQHGKPISAEVYSMTRSRWENLNA